MGVCAGIEHYAVEVAVKSLLVQPVYYVPLVIALVIVNLDIGIIGLNGSDIVLHRHLAVDVGFAHAEQIQVRTVDNQYSCHNILC
jgi:hypothetical protein